MSRFPLAAAVLLVAAAAQAQTAAERQTVEVAGSSVPLPDAATLRAMTGDFALSDGRTLRVLRPSLHLMAAVGKRWAVTVEPVAPNRFASRDGRLVVEYDAGLDTLRVIEDSAVTVARRHGGTATQ
jgi:hypothetical protein